MGYHNPLQLPCHDNPNAMMPTDCRPGLSSWPTGDATCWIDSRPTGDYTV